MSSATDSSSSPDFSSDAFPAQARVVIIGGGVMGCGLAYHLAHEGWTDIVLLEKGELTSGSTWHAAGQGSYATSHYGIAKCVKYNIELYGRILEAETGQSVTWHGCGSLRMAYTRDEADWHRHALSVVRGLELPAEIVDVAAVQKLHPFYNTAGIRSALHTPIDGHVDPAGATFALAKGARQLGAKIIRHTRATKVEQLPSGEWRVSTDKGEIVCEHIVNAGGVYARQLALQNGYDLPTTSMTHHYIVTDTVPEFKELAQELPVVRDDKNVSGYIRMEQKSGLIGIYEKENPNPVWLDGAPWEAEHELFEPHYERIAPWLEAAFERVPIFAELGIKRAVHGAISHPPDGNPLIGPAPKLKNYWVCAGCQIGLGWGPALTRELARWMVHNASDINMRDFDPRRFGDYADGAYQKITAEEDYRLRHEIPYPHFSRAAGRPAKTGVLHDRLKDTGAVHEPVYGWERPRWFAPQGTPAEDIYSYRRSALYDIIRAEVQAVQNAAGVIDISAFGKVRVRGSGAAAFLDRLTPGRVPAAGRIGLAYFLYDSGRIAVEATAAHLGGEEGFYLGCAPFFEQRLLDILNHARRPDEQVEVDNLSQKWAAVALNGPLSRTILSACTDAPLDSDSFPWMRVQQVTIGAHKVWALHMSYAGEQGWELHGAQDAIAAAFDALHAAGKPHGLANYGIFALDSMRMEKAFCGAAELTNEVTMAEAGVMRFAKMDKGDFVGKDAMVAAAGKPLRWQCAYLEVEEDGEQEGHGSEAVLADGKRIGVVTSIATGHRTGKVLAFAYISPEHAAPGSEVQVLVQGAAQRAVVLGAPVYDPANDKPKS